MKPFEVDVDLILKETGKFGRYQIQQSLWMILPIILCSMHMGNYIFIARDIDYRCRVPECESEFGNYSAEWVQWAIPPSKISEFEKCSRYPINDTWHNPNDQCTAQLFDNSALKLCDGYIYNEKGSFVEEMNIPCENWKVSLIGTVNSVGSLCGTLVIGVFSDVFGRRLTLVLSCIMAGLFGVIKSFSLNYEMFMVFEFVEPLLGSGVYSAIYILAMELLTPSLRVLAGSLINIYYGIGQVLMGLFAWIFPYWRTYVQVIYAPIIIFFVYHWITDESIRWYIAKHRYKEAIDTINKIAKINGKTVSKKALENLTKNQEMTDIIKESISSNKNKDTPNDKETPPWKLVLKSKVLILRVLTNSFWWITYAFVFNGLSINSYLLPGNFYVNFMIQSAMELPSHIIALFLLNRIGRKLTLMMSFLICGIFLLSFPFIPESLIWLSLVCFLIGKLFIALAVNAVYIYTSELFPTPLRHSLMSTCSTIGRIGSILAPLTPLLVAIDVNLPLYLFAGCCFISSALLLTSPETLHKKLPETVEEAENISSSKPNIDA